jgi:hypothetical protein
MPMRTLLILTTLLTSSSLLQAQSVRGVAVEAEGGMPIAGGTVVLLDTNDARVHAVLADDAGRFHLRAPAPGRYRLRLERIGYAATFSPYFDLAAGEVRDQSLTVQSRSVQLAGIRVTGRRRCDLRPQEGLQTQTLWEEARKALTATTLTREQRLLRVEIDRYAREVEVPSGVLVSETTSTRSGTSENPFVSLPAEELVERGFVWPEPDAWTYHAPDADVLLSDAFLDSHCFRVVASEDTSLIGLGFEPHRRRTVLGVQGVLWLDRETAELRHLEYGYTGLPRAWQPDHVGGYVGFERISGGHWIVRRWWIRMPRSKRESWVRGGHVTTMERVVSYREEGGEVVAASSARGTGLAAPERAVLRGAVFDSTRTLPLPGATVYLSGTDHTAETDSAGGFSIPGLREATYRVGFWHPRVDSLGTDIRLEDARVRRDDPEWLLLAIPSVSTLLSEACSREQRNSGARVVAGVVRDGATGEAVAGARVTLSWGKYAIVQGPIIGTETEASTRTDDRGRFRICTVPGPSAVFAAAEREGFVGRERVSDEGTLVYQEIEIHPPAAGR